MTALLLLLLPEDVRARVEPVLLPILFVGGVAGTAVLGAELWRRLRDERQAG